MTTTGYFTIALISGLLAGMIAHGRVPTVKMFVRFFLAGAVLPVLGVVVACFAKPDDDVPVGRHNAE